MRLFEKAWHFTNAFFCFFFFFFAATFPEYRWIPSKKIIYRSSDSQCNSVLCCYERKFFWSILLLYKWQQRGIPQRLLDKCSHLFIWTLLKQTSSSRKNLLKWHDDTEQIALAVMFYFGQVFVFWRLVNKNMLGWFLLIMCKEDTLIKSTNLFSKNHPILCFWLRRECRQMPNTE